MAFRLGAYDRTRPLVIDPLFIHSSFLGGSDGDFPSAVAQLAGEWFITGYTLSQDFPGALNLRRQSGDVFVTRLSADGGRILFTLYLGGSHLDQGAAIALQPARFSSEVDAILVGGSTSSQDFPVFGSGAAPNKPGRDGFIARLKLDGSQLLYSTCLGGALSDDVEGIATDGFHIFVTGTTGSPDFPTSHAFQWVPAGIDAFVTALAPVWNGFVFSYSTRLGGSAVDSGRGIAVVPGSTTVIVAGGTTSADFPVKAPPGQVVLQQDQPGSDSFVTKILFTGSAQIEYSTYLGGSASDDASAIGVDGAGNAYVVGATYSADLPTRPAGSSFGRIPHTSATAADAFAAKLSANGSQLLYCGYLGGTGEEWGQQIAVDTTGFAWVTGRTQSPDLPLVNALQGPSANAVDMNAFAAAISADGTRLAFSSYLGGSSSDSGGGIAVFGPTPNTVQRGGPPNPARVLVTGVTLSSDVRVTTNARQPASGGDFDGFYTLFTNAVGAGLSGAWLQAARREGLPLQGSRCTFSGELRVDNPGFFRTPPTVAALYLSTDEVLDPSDRLLRRLSVPGIAPGTSRRLPLPPTTAPSGRERFLIAVFDATDLVPEPNESNNLAVSGPLQ